MRKINNWRPEVTSLLRRLQKAGFDIVQCDNGEDCLKCERSTTVSEMVDNLTACDEGHVYVKGKDNKVHWLFLVLGNSPGELVCDYSVSLSKEHEWSNLALDVATREHYDAWEGRKQPSKLIPA